jgi:copper chaperone NosL
MLVSDPRLAAQIVAPGEAPLFFDDIGCLRDYLTDATPPEGAIAYVADHRSGAWVIASAAVYTKSAERQTPMASGLIAHTEESSRAADPMAAGGERLTVQSVFGPAGPPAGRAP